MGKVQTAAQTTTPQVDQEAPTTASGELTGLQAELMRAQQLAGAGNAYVQDQLNQQAAASVEAVQAATAEAVVVSQSPESEVADVEQAIEEVEVAVEGAEEGGGITGDAPPSDAGGAPEEVAVEAATGTEEAVAPESAAPAHAETGGETLDARTEVKKEFGKVYRSTSAAETDAWLDALQAREATEPELAGLAAELRAWTLEQRAVKAAKAAATTATTSPETPPAEVIGTGEAEATGWWSLLVGIKDALKAAMDAMLSLPRRVIDGVKGLWDWAFGREATQQDHSEQTERSERGGLLSGLGGMAPGAYDEQAAQAWMDTVLAQLDSIPITFDVDGERVDVTIQVKYRNVKSNDWLNASRGDYGYQSRLAKGQGSDGIKHSASFGLAYGGKGSPEDMRVAIQEAVDGDPALQATLAKAWSESPELAAETLEAWAERKLGLDCIGFAWHILNGSGMTDSFTPGAKGEHDTAQEKLLNYNCAGFKQYAKNIHSDPDSWRALDCMVTNKHIIVIYACEKQPDGSYVLETMESSSSKGPVRRNYLYKPSERKAPHKGWYRGLGKDASPLKSGEADNEVYRAENSDKHQANLDKLAAQG